MFKDREPEPYPDRINPYDLNSVAIVQKRLNDKSISGRLPPRVNMYGEIFNPYDLTQVAEITLPAKPQF